MNKTKVILLTVFALFALAGANMAAAVEPAAGQEYVQVVDGIGRTVRVPKNPERVAAVFAPAAHILGMLGASEKIVTISRGNMRDYFYLQLYPTVLDVRLIGGNGGVLNSEELFREPAPQVVFCDSSQGQDQRAMETLEKFGIPFVVINFRNVEELKRVILMVGEIMGLEERARIYCEYIDKTEELIAARMADLPPEQRPLVHRSINELLRSEISNSVPGDWMTRLGINLVGTAVVPDSGTAKNSISLETLFSYDPEYILVTGADVYDYINATEKLHSLRAYQEGHIFLMPNGISRWAHQNSIEVPPSALWTFKTIYPERFADIDIVVETRNFYREVFAVELDDETIEQILSGRDLRGLKSRSDVEGRDRDR